jgi:diguanylate cyclase (GGDEF)-like protein
MAFSLKMEVISILIISVLMVFNHGEESVSKIKDRWFNAGLIMSLASICVNVLSTWAIRLYWSVPVWLNYFLASVYYLLISFSGGVIALYIFYLIYEHAHDKRGLKIVNAVNVAMFGVLIIMVAANLWTGDLFFFQNGEYCRGPLNSAGYWALGVDVLLVIVCYLCHRQAVNSGMKKMIRILPGVVVVVVVFQLIYRDVMMNGMLLALVNVIMYISFQNIHFGVDGLTGLGNRGAFVETLTRWRQSKKKFHVVFVNLREFRQVNLKFGQQAGDEFLYTVGRYLGQRPPCAHAYRLGSVNFAILCDRDNCPNVGQCIETIQERFRHPWQVGNMEYKLSACYADLLWEGQNWNSAQIIDRLEFTMEMAKYEGENTRVRFSDEIDKMMERQKYIIEQVKWALTQKSFEVYYQPIYSWRDEKFRSAEALVRLRDQNGDMIMPGEFIPVAERTGMIGDISWIVTEKVCAFLAEHPDLPLDSISVNLSRQQFMDKDLEQRLLGLIQQYNIAPSRLKIEVTEGTIARNPQRTEQIMAELVGKGIGFYLDDFGVGYSNFSAVMRLPFETIKLDKSLTDKILSTERAHQFVSAMVRMFVDGGYAVVAEGAEDSRTVEELKKLGVDRIQGFYYAKPMEEKAFCELLTG